MDNNDIQNFHEALKAERLYMIDMFIQNGLRINMEYRYSYYESRYQIHHTFTPLIEAVKNQSIKVIKHLLKRGADVLIQSVSNENPLSAATQKGNLEIVKLLVENGAKPTMQTALLVAIEEINLDIVKYLIEEGVCINWEYANGKTPLSVSIENWSEEISKFLIDNENIAIPTMQAALLLAIKHRGLDIVKSVVEKGVSVNWEYANGDTPLSTSIKNRCEEISKFLIYNENITIPTMQAALLLAIKNRGLDIVKSMVEKGVSVNWEYTNGDTPLSTAIKNGCEEISKFLIDNGANLDKFTNSYSTPLILSVENRMLDTLKYLIKKGASIDQIDSNGRTALLVAAEKSNLGCAKYLIESGADISLAQKAVDAYAQRNDDFKYFLKNFTMKQEQLKSISSNVKETSSTADDKKCLHCLSLLKLSDKESGYGQEEAPSPEK